jgi:hypothetical protein
MNDRPMTGLKLTNRDNKVDANAMKKKILVKRKTINLEELVVVDNHNLFRTSVINHEFISFPNNFTGYEPKDHI